MATLYYGHPDFMLHNTGTGHPESALRLRAIEQILTKPEFAGLIRVTPSIAEDIEDKLKLIHSPQMISRLMSQIPAEGLVYLDQDTVVSPGSKQAALLAVSAACDAVDKVISKAGTNAFCAIRPPGHHAEPDRAMGFCLFNNIAIAAEYARIQHRLQKIAIIDFDVHHGNGTQQAFINQANVFYASSHQWPLYPGTGAASETGAGNIVNVPLASHTTRAEFRNQYLKLILPALNTFNPDFILISAGFDAHHADPLATLKLDENDYRWLTGEIMTIAEHCCDGRIVSVLEGGYQLDALANSVAAHIATLAEI